MYLSKVWGLISFFHPFIGIFLYTIYVCMYICMYVCTHPSTRAGCDTMSILRGVWLAPIYSFPSPRLVAIPSLKSPITYAKLEEEELDSYISKCEVQTVSSMIWTCISVSISCDSNYYALNAYIYIYIYIKLSDRSRGQPEGSLFK